MKQKVICRKTRRPAELCPIENQRCKRCGALLAPAAKKPASKYGGENVNAK